LGVVFGAWAQVDLCRPRCNDRREPEEVRRCYQLSHRSNSYSGRGVKHPFLDWPATSGGDDGATADALLVAVHAAPFADTNLGGLRLGIRQLDCEWGIEGVDATAAAIPARYQITAPVSTIYAHLSIVTPLCYSPKGGGCAEGRTHD
jgi:hypothetical protein